MNADFSFSKSPISLQHATTITSGSIEISKLKIIYEEQRHFKLVGTSIKEF